MRTLGTESAWGRLGRRSFSWQYLLTLFSTASFRSFHNLRNFRSSAVAVKTPVKRALTARPVTCLTVSKSTFATSEEEKMTRDCRVMIDAAIQAVDPVVAVKNVLTAPRTSLLRVKDEHGDRQYALEDYDKVVVVAFGKASSAMATAVLDRLLESGSNANISGLVITKEDHSTLEERDYLAANNINLLEASHPVPDSRSFNASVELLELVRETASDCTLVIACISGGGSSLFCAPNDRLSLDDLRSVNNVLLHSGWNIQDMNILRKRLEQGKGGRLAEAAHPGQVLSLILSDVVGDPLDLIASGPTVPDTSSWEDAWDLVQRLPANSLPATVTSLLQDGVAGKLQDSPSKSHPVFRKCQNCLVGNNALAVKGAAHKAKQLGYHPIVLGNQLEGEASEVARFLVCMSQHARHGPPLFSFATQFPLALIVGGETTVTLPSDSTGKGGRNQELALAAALQLQKMRLRQVVVASVGTDGSDGPTDAAGAIVDGGMVERLPGSAKAALRRHDAYSYLGQTDPAGFAPLLKVRVAIVKRARHLRFFFVTH